MPETVAVNSPVTIRYCDSVCSGQEMPVGPAGRPQIPKTASFMPTGSSVTSGCAPAKTRNVSSQNPCPTTSTPEKSRTTPSPPEAHRFGAWLDGYGVFGDVEGDGNSADTHFDLGGVLGGLDLRLSEHALLGAGAGWGSLDVGVSQRSFAGDAEVAQAFLYGGYVRERFYLGGLARYAWDGPVFAISALTGEGTQALAREVMRYLEETASAEQAESKSGQGL